MTTRLQKDPPSDNLIIYFRWTNLRKVDHGQYFLHLQQKGTGKNESFQRELNPQQSPQRHQNKKKFSRSLVC